MALPPSTANWHWKNKNCTRWGTEWLERELVGTSATGDNGEVVEITKVDEVDGDVELGQRKSKLITIFDVKVVLKWSGKTTDGETVSGTLTIPEVSHEIICDQLSDYQFNWVIKDSSSPKSAALSALARAKLPDLLKVKLNSFPQALIDAHGKDLTVTGSAEPSRSGTPAPPTNTLPSAKELAAESAKKATTTTPSRKGINTTTVVVEANFQASADDLFGLLTDEKRIPAWTRAAAVSKGKAGTDYSLFGGGVTGKYISITPSKEIMQSWILKSPTWPSGHEATLTTTLDQSSDSTKVTFSLAGVPTGMEQELKHNIEGYYVHGFKAIGYVYLVPTAPVYSEEYMQKKTQALRSEPPQFLEGMPPLTTSNVMALVLATLVLVAAFAVPFLNSRP